MKPKSPLTPREKMLLRALLDLRQKHIDISITMASKAMGLTHGRSMSPYARSLEAKGMIARETVRHNCVLLRLTLAGVRIAGELPELPNRRAARLDNDPVPERYPDARRYREEPWRGQSMKRPYTDADISREILNPYLPEREQRSGTGSAAWRCVEEAF